MKLPIAPLPSGSVPFDFVAVGECSLDFVGLMATEVVAGAKVPLEEFAVCPGGQAATAAAGCARLGWRSRCVGTLGRDPWGERIAAALDHESVDLHAVWRDDVPTRTAIILVSASTGDRTVLSHRDARLTLSHAEHPLGAATSGRILLVDAVDPAWSTEAARAARARGIPTIVDVDEPGPAVEGLLEEADVLVVPRTVPERMTGLNSPGAGARELMRRFSPAVVVVTLGAEGALGLAAGREYRVRPPAVAVRDTTGAGDAFRAGFAAGWLEMGPDAAIDELLRFATAVAALNCRDLGAQTALPGRRELDPFL